MNSPKCPLCGAKRDYPLPARKERDHLVRDIHKLRKAGYSLREIAKLVGFKSHNAVAYVLKNGI